MKRRSRVRPCGSSVSMSERFAGPLQRYWSFDQIDLPVKSERQIPTERPTSRADVIGEGTRQCLSNANPYPIQERYTAVVSAHALGATLLLRAALSQS